MHDMFLLLADHDTGSVDIDVFLDFMMKAMHLYTWLFMEYTFYLYYRGHFLMISFIIWLKPWTPPPPPPPYDLCLLFPGPAFLSVLCTAFSLWYVQFSICVMCIF